jgi:hypothetical protein
MSDRSARDEKLDSRTTEDLPIDAADPRQPAARKKRQVGSAGGGPYAAGPRTSTPTVPTSNDQ